MRSSRALLLIFIGVAACDGASPASDATSPELDAGAPAGDAAAGADAAVPSDAAPPGDAGSPPPAEPRYVGRYALDAEAVRFSWPGSGLIVRFRGTALRVTMNDAAGFFTVVIDGEVQPTLALSGGVQTYTVAGGLADAEHTVELYRRTEGFFGATVVTRVEVDGEMLPVPVPARSIEVVGDSISAGYGVDGADQYCSFSAGTENHYLTYGAVAARALGAELSTVAWSGKGVVHNYGDDRVEPMPALYGRAIAAEDGSTGTIRPVDAVVVNLGTNDFSTDGDPSADEFTPAYVSLLAAVRAQHPDAEILCTVAPLLAGDDGTRARTYIEAAIAERQAAGDDRVSWVDLGTAAIVEDWGCDWHPGDLTQAAMGARLVAALETELGW
ncbi:MAG: GDSL-type esterase/lipase family protein [Sandaracinaceae bacterium]|nr:GDSL-type esterase/lipase family protein [Sandaracinaceae bacterium]